MEWILEIILVAGVIGFSEWLYGMKCLEDEYERS
jgi:hypothetical protein